MSADLSARSTTALNDSLRNFVYSEARLLDEGRYEEWLALFTEDAYYWMPLEVGQADAKHVTSLMHEDLFMLTLRVRRLSGARTFSQHPPSRCHHLLQHPAIDAVDPEQNRYVVTTAFHFVETRRDEQQLYAGWARHELTEVQGSFKIKQKRIDLVNPDAAFGNIQLLM